MRICFFGDSFVNGYGDLELLGWPGRVCAAAVRRGNDVTAYNLGVRRYTSADVWARWRDEAARRLAIDGRAVFSFGANDAAQKMDEDESVANLRTILTAASAEYPTLMVGPPPATDQEIDRRIGQLCRRFAAECHEIGVPYLDTFSTLASSEVWAREVREFDGVHPRAGGYRALAELIESWPAWGAWFERSVRMEERDAS